MKTRKYYSKRIKKSKRKKKYKRELTNKKARGRNTLQPTHLSIINACKLTNKFIHNESFTDSESSLSSDSETKSKKTPKKTPKETADDRIIGKGGFSHIFFCKKKYALKFTGYKTWEDFHGEDTYEFKKYMQNEVNLQNELARHGLSLKIDFSGFMEEKDRELWHYSIMQKAEGDIRHLINLIIKMKAEVNMDDLVKKITTLYDELQELKYTHGDIRPGNIIYILKNKKDINSVKFYLIDFNFAGKYEEYIEREKKEQSELKKREREKRMAERQKKLQSKPKFPGGKNTKPKKHMKHKKLTKQKNILKPKKLTKQKKKLYGENDKWPKEITYLIYKEDGLTTKEKLYISKTLKIKALRLFLNLRYPTDPVRYNSMNKDQLIKELKYKRYD